MTAGKWTSQPDLFSYPKSHWADPETSRAAAESISLEKITWTQERVLTVFKFHGPLADEKLVELFKDYWPDSATDQGIRSRRGELVRKGLVVDTGERSTTRYGRSCVVWRLS